jgi:hypothetical protein
MSPTVYVPVTDIWDVNLGNDGLNQDITITHYQSRVFERDFLLDFAR